MDRTSILQHAKNKNLHQVIDQSDLIGGKYKIINHLGVPSGQADIYLCEMEFENYIVKLYKPGLQINKDIHIKIAGIQSERIVPILESGEYKRRWYEVSPYYEKGDLSRVEKVDEGVLRSFVIPFINEALRDIHKHDIAHMDLKPSNIFIDVQDNLYLGDFGICSVLADESVKVTSAKGTLGYRPPESYSEVSIKSTQFDYYCFGMTIIHLWKGRSPYEGMSEMQIMAHTLDGKIPIPEEMDKSLQTLVMGLTEYDKRKRLCYEDVRRWCSGQDISELVSTKSLNLTRRITASRKSRVSDGSKHSRYEFAGNLVDSPDEFAELATKTEAYWQEAVNRLRNDQLEDFFKAQREDFYSVLKHAKEIEHDDLALSYLILKTSSQGMIVWRMARYDDIEAFGKAMQLSLPGKLNTYDDMHEAGFIEVLIEHHGFIMKQAYATKWTEYLTHAYTFSRSTLFKYGGDYVSTFDELVDVLCSQSADILTEIDILMNNENFEHWLAALKRKI